MRDILLAITDDDNLIAELLQEFLSKCEGYKVLFTASDGNNLIAKLRASQNLPDVLLLDLKMPGMDGIEATRQLKIHFPAIKIIVISSHYKQSFLNFMFKTGASAFVPKGISAVLLKDVIWTVYTKGIYFMDDQVESMRTKNPAKSSRPSLINPTELSERETDIIRLISMQKTANEIGEILCITGRTVEGHKNNLFIKTGAKNIAGLVVYAIQHDIISIDQLPKI